MTYLTYNSGKKTEKGKEMCELQCSHSQFKTQNDDTQFIKVTFESRVRSNLTCFCSPWLWPHLGCQPVGHQTRQFFNQSPPYILNKNERNLREQYLHQKEHWSKNFFLLNKRYSAVNNMPMSLFNSSSTENVIIQKFIHLET